MLKRNRRGSGAAAALYAYPSQGMVEAEEEEEDEIEEEDESEEESEEGEQRTESQVCLKPRNILPDLALAVDQQDTAPWCPTPIECLSAGLNAYYAGLQNVGANSLEVPIENISAKAVLKRSPATRSAPEDVPAAPNAAFGAATFGVASADVASGQPALFLGQLNTQTTPAAAAAVPPSHEVAVGPGVPATARRQAGEAALAPSAGFVAGTAPAAANIAESSPPVPLVALSTHAALAAASDANSAAAAAHCGRQDAAARAARLELPKSALPAAAVAMACAADAPPAALLPDLKLYVEELKAWEALRARRDAAQAALIKAFQSTSARLQQKAMKELHAVAKCTAEAPQLPDALMMAVALLPCQPEAQAAPLAVTAVPFKVSSGLGRPASATSQLRDDIGIGGVSCRASGGHCTLQQVHAAEAQVPQAAGLVKSLKRPRVSTSEPPTAERSKNDKAQPATAASFIVLECPGRSARLVAATRAAMLPKRRQVLTGMSATAPAGAAVRRPYLFSLRSAQV